MKVFFPGIYLAHIEQEMAEPTKSTSLHLVCKGIHCQQGDNQKTRISITINPSKSLEGVVANLTFHTKLEQ